MNSLTASALATRIGGRSWTCSACRSQLGRGNPWSASGGRNFFSGSSSPSKHTINNKKRAGRTVLLASGGVATGVGAALLAFGDDITTSYEATKRAGRVAATLGICINE